MSSKISDDTGRGGDKDFGEKLADLNINGSDEGKSATGENDGHAEGTKTAPREMRKRPSKLSIPKIKIWTVVR